MSMRMRLLVAVSLLAVAGTVAVATAQERPRRQGRPDFASLEKELGLSADQSAQLGKLRAEGRKQAIRQRADVAIARLELQELMDATTVDEKAVAAKVKAISDLQAAALLARTNQRLAMRRLLTPEQQEKMRQLAPRQGRPGRQGRMGRPGRAGRPGPGMAPPGPGGPWAGEDDEPLSLEPER
jgi:Spy/CpxP family protein refolding chaperone